MCENIEFRKSNFQYGNWWNILKDDERVGWVHESDSLFEVRISTYDNKFVICKDFGSFPSAQNAVYEYYGEGVFNSLTEVPI